MFSEENNIHEVIELHPNEVQLIKAIRERFKFGEITIKTRNGLPFRLIRTEEFIDLNNDSHNR